MNNYQNNNYKKQPIPTFYQEDRPAPHSLPLEKEILAMLFNMMLSKKDKDISLSNLDEEYFYSPNHKEIFKSMQEVFNECELIDSLMVADKLKHKNMLEDVGGEVFLMELEHSVATVVGLEEKINMLKTYYIRRQTIIKSAEIMAQMYDNEYDKHKLGISLAEIDKIQMINKKFELKSTTDIMKNATKMVLEANTVGSGAVIPTGFPTLDEQVILLRKQLHVVAAESGVGKTGFSLSCVNRQIKKGLKVAFFCGESTSEELMLRLNCIQTGRFSFTDYMQRIENPNIMNGFQQAFKDIGKYKDNLFLYGKGDYEHSLIGIKNILNRLTLETDLDIIYIDYLQNLSPNPTIKEKFLQVENDIQGINNLLGELNVAGVVMSQLNRDKAQGAKPTTRNLKYSSTIENEAHLISFLHETNHGEVGAEMKQIELFSGKVRLISNYFINMGMKNCNGEYVEVVNHRYSEEDGRIN